MALILAARPGAQWIELYAGAALLLAPATSLVLAQARAKAREMLVDLTTAGMVVTRHGGVITGTPDTDSEAAIAGLLETLAVVCMVELAAEDWRGVLDAAGRPLRFDAARLPDLLEDERVMAALRERWMQPLFEVLDEKKDWPRSQDGTSTGSAAEPIATGAGSPKRRARPARRDDAPTTPTRPARRLDG